MTTPSRRALPARAARRGLILAALALAGCASLLPKPGPAPTLFALDETAAALAPSAARPTAAARLTLVVAPPRAAAGFDTARIVYMRQAHELQAFAYHQWVDTPAQMLAPLIVTSVERSGAFRVVLAAPTTAATDLRLDTELVRLQHEFVTTPSRVRLTLRAVLVETATRRVVAAREFEATAASPSEDPYGGVIAANRAAAIVLAELAAFCAEAAAGLPAVR